MAAWDNGLTQLQNLWKSMSIGQRLVMILTAVGSVAAVLALTTWFATADYSLLFGGLTTDDAAEIVETLKAEKIPYQVGEGGRSIKVPADKVYDTRLLLASRGIPQGKEVGYEIFDKFSFGMTNFAQRMNFLRALEGELTRTIKRINGVESARVHLVIPEKRLFEDKEQPTTASVVLRLKPAASISQKQVQGIVFLVSSSVEGLKAENVSVIDASGNVLHKGNEEEGAALASNQFELKTNFEKETERRVRDMLERVLGMGTAVVRVSAEFDFDRLEQTSEVFNPDTAVIRSESHSTETSTGAVAGPSGIPGVASNVGGGTEAAKNAANQQGGTPSRTDKETSTTNYEISRTVTKTVKSPAKLTKMSVAVVVDGSYKEPAQAGGEREFVPRTQTEIASIRALVEKASGIDAKRGDQVEVTSIPFRPSETVEAQPAGFLDRTIVMVENPFYAMLLKYGVGSLVGVLLLLFVIRPMLRFLSEGPKPVTVQALAAAGGKKKGAIPAELSLENLEREMETETEETMREYKLEEKMPEETLKRESLKTRIIELINKEPETAANLVKSWMNEVD